MRLIIDSLIALMLAALLVGVIYHNRDQSHRSAQCQVVAQALARLHEQVLYHGALGQREARSTPFPARISPLWFDRDVPFNSLVPGRQPWIDVAPAGDLTDNPPDPIIQNSDQAGFWYNPNRGIIRARVAPQFTEVDTLSLYNEINGTALSSLARASDPARQPQPLSFARLDESDLPAGMDGTQGVYASTESSGSASISQAGPTTRPHRTSLVDDPVGGPIR